VKVADGQCPKLGRQPRVINDLLQFQHPEFIIQGLAEIEKRSPDMKNMKSQSGQALILIAFAMVGLIAVTALAVDGGRAYEDRRHAQNAADTASLAAALAKLKTPAGGNEILNAKNAAKARATSNGYTNGVNNATVEVNFCNESGVTCNGLPAGANKADYIRVKITSIINTTFAKVIGRQQLTNVVEAIAKASGTTSSASGGGSGYGITALKDSGTGLDFSGSGDFYIDGSIATNADLDLAGSGTVHITQDFIAAGKLTDTGTTDWLIDGDVWVNGFQKTGSHGWTVGGTFFDNKNFSVGGSAYLTAGTLQVVGTAATNGNVTPWPPQSVASQAPTYLTDPYASVLNPPANPGGCNSISHGAGTLTLDPGCYTSITQAGGGTLKLNDGIYYIIGDFTVKGTSNLDAPHVMIYMESGAFKQSGSGDVILGPTTISPYAGLTMYVDRNNANDVTLNGSGTAAINGTIYAPNSAYKLTGSYSSVVSDSQIICSWADIQGSGDFNLVYDPANNYNPTPPGSPEIQFIQ